MGRAFSALETYMQAHGLTPAGPPRAVYTVSNPEGSRFHRGACQSPHPPARKPEPGPVRVGELPAGRCSASPTMGPTVASPEMYGAIAEWLKEHGWRVGAGLGALHADVGRVSRRSQRHAARGPADLHLPAARRVRLRTARIRARLRVTRAATGSSPPFRRRRSEGGARAMRCAINVPNFGEYGDPRLLADLAHDKRRVGTGSSSGITSSSLTRSPPCRSPTPDRAGRCGGGDRAYPAGADGHAARAPSSLESGARGRDARPALGRAGSSSV